MKDADRLAEALSLCSHIPCPCCGGELECLSDCTFTDDCPEEAYSQRIARTALAAYRARPQSSDALDGQAALDEANNAVVDRDREIAMLRPVVEAARAQYLEHARELRGGMRGCGCVVCIALRTLSRLDGGGPCDLDYTPPLTADGAMKARLVGEGSLPPPAWDDGPAPTETARRTASRGRCDGSGRRGGANETRSRVYGFVTGGTLARFCG